MTRQLTRRFEQTPKRRRKNKCPVIQKVIPRLSRYCLECYRLLDWHGAIVYVITLKNALDRDGEQKLSAIAENIIQLHQDKHYKAAFTAMKILSRQIKLKQQNVNEKTN